MTTAGRSLFGSFGSASRQSARTICPGSSLGNASEPFHARCTPELVELLRVGMARDIFGDCLALLADSLAFRLTGGLGRDLAQQCRKTDIPRTGLGFQFLAD